MTNRRQFLALSTFAVASSAWAKAAPADRLGGPVFSEASRGAYAQGLLTRKHLEALVGSLFMVFLDDDAVAYMRLKKVAEFPSSVSSANTNTTVKRVGVTATSSATAVESFYVVDHGTLGRFAVLLVPSPESAPERTCTATFTSFVG